MAQMTRQYPKLRRAALLAVVMLLCSSVLAGCSARAKIEDALMFGSSSKQNALTERLERFNRARYWGGLAESLGYVADTYQTQFLANERSKAAGQRIVRTDVTQVDIEPNGSTAKVQMEVRYFEKPTYLVKTRTEEQTWKFHRFGGGWLLTEADASQEGQIDESGPQQMRGMPSRSPYDF